MLVRHSKSGCRVVGGSFGDRVVVLDLLVLDISRDLEDGVVEVGAKSCCCLRDLAKP